MASAAHAGEASGPRRVITFSAAREARAEGDEDRGSGTGQWECATGVSRGRDVDVERRRKRRRLIRHTESDEGRGHVRGRRGSAHMQWYLLVWRMRAHHRHAVTVKRKVKDGTAALPPLLRTPPKPP
ncbi:hypothetical protein TRVL_10351 [Trypanosoma vivax]|nr:hypothetical protein TRVL_10351 [Trypanosoma vivax]